MKQLIILSLIALLFTACSQKNMYDSMRKSQEMMCSKYEGAQKQKCLSDAKMSYQKYESAQ